MTKARQVTLRFINTCRSFDLRTLYVTGETHTLNVETPEQDAMVKFWLRVGAAEVTRVAAKKSNPETTTGGDLTSGKVAEKNTAPAVEAPVSKPKKY